MKKSTILMLLSMMLAACGHHDSPDPDPPTPDEAVEQAVVMYMPWSKQSSTDNIYTNSLKNIADMKTAIARRQGADLNGRKLMVLVAQSESQACLINIRYDKASGQCINDTLKRYTGLTGYSYASSAGLQTLFNDVRTAAKANTYAMIIGCHGMGWIPSGTEIYAKRFSWMEDSEAEEAPLVETRYFGNPGNAAYQTNITELAQAIRGSFGHLDYMIFDDCYMANIETIYDLRDVTDYYVASSTEMMITGIPYADVGINILYQQYEQLCSGFYSYYIDNGISSYGTLAVVKMSEAEGMAAIMKRINAACPQENMSSSDRMSVQRQDNYYYGVFYDMDDYVRHLCTDDALYAEFGQQLRRLVLHATCTPHFWSNRTAGDNLRYCGITISDMSTHANVLGKKEKTNWWQATH